MSWQPAGFEVKRFALYDAREETALPDLARAALEARALDAVTFFSPRAASVFASMVEDAGLAANLRDVTAIAISPAALAPAAGLPFKAARRPPSGPPARPCSTRSTDWPKPLYKDRRP